MKEYKTMAHINSLKGEMAEITVLDKVGDNDYIVDYYILVRKEGLVSSK